MKRKRNPRVETRLNTQTFQELQSHALARGVRPTVILREALLFYLSHLDESNLRRRERAISDQLQEATGLITQAVEMTSMHLATLLIKTAVSVETTNEYLALVEKTRKTMDTARKTAAEKISRVLEADK